MIAKLVLIGAGLAVSCLMASGQQTKAHWEYDKQDKWPKECFGKKQSPINLPDICYPDPNNKVTITPKVRYDPRGYNTLLPAQKMKITNNGHTISVTVNGWDSVVNDAPSIQFTGLSRVDTYQFTELHFHWAHNGTHGSEHEIAGTRFPLEMHIVHFNKKYKTKAASIEKPDGLLVLGVFFHEDVTENPTLNPVINHVKLVRKKGATANFTKPFSLQTILPPETSNFYFYLGSLTTPPCAESVTWLLIADIQNLGYSQLKEFQKLDHDENRFRKIQARNGRNIYANSNAFCIKRYVRGNQDEHGQVNRGFKWEQDAVPTGQAGPTLVRSEAYTEPQTAVGELMDRETKGGGLAGSFAEQAVEPAHQRDPAISV